MVWPICRRGFLPPRRCRRRFVALIQLSLGRLLLSRACFCFTGQTLGSIRVEVCPNQRSILWKCYTKPNAESATTRGNERCVIHAVECIPKDGIKWCPHGTT